MSETVQAGKSAKFYLNAGDAITVVAASGGTGTLYRLADTPGGGNSLESYAITSAETQVVGPYFTPTRWDLRVATGTIDWSTAVAERFSNVDFLQFGSTEIAAETMGGGTSASPISTANAGKNAIGFWFKTTATSGDSRGLYLRKYFAGAGVSGEAARIFGTVDNVTAATGGTVNGAHITLSVSGASGAVSGAGNGLRVTLGLGDGTNAGGTLSVIQVDTDFDNGATVPASVAGLRFTSSNTKKLNYVFAFDGTNGLVWDDDFGTEPTTAAGGLKVLINGSDRWIPLYSVAPVA